MNQSDTTSPEFDKNTQRRMRRVSRWLRRLGWVGVLFFAAKGLVWLLIFWGAGSILGC
jgi:hypothetical protein